MTPRERTLGRLHAAVREGRALLATGAGTGLAAGAAEAGGADLVVVYNSGRYRAAGLSSLSGLMPYGNANDVMLELAAEVLGAVDRVPVLAGVCATDPFRDIEALVAELARMGVAGVQNFPTVGLVDGRLREELEATGIRFEAEVELVRVARRAGLLTCAFVTDVGEARRMALAGVDVLAPHLGVTRSASEGDALARAAAQVQAMADAGREVRDDLLVLFHGGPAASPVDVQVVLDATAGVHGFFAASSVERGPVQDAVRDAARSFRALRAGDRLDGARAIMSAPDFSTVPPELGLELTPDSLPDYLRARGLVDPEADLEVEELGGGVSNVILRYSADGRCGVVKQSRPRLKVAALWLSDVRRILNERDAIAVLEPRLPAGSVPAVTFTDSEHMAFGMRCAPEDAPLWKPLLLAGRLEPERAEQAGALLRTLHDATRDDPDLEQRFVCEPLLDQNRLDPWYRATAERHPDLAEIIEYAVQRLLSVRHVLVHGDYVPKNIFLLPDRLLLLDYEVVHYGNPGYDVATFVNHMLLKGLRFAEHREGFLDLAQRFWSAYADRMPARDRALAEDEGLLQLGALMLARVDGKSRVEYLVDHPAADDARALGRWLLRTRPGSFDEVFDRYSATAEDHAAAEVGA
jgi:predicted TIM-barrel enzyme/aminoglycoside phosphotransferase (APT) family kinase protein